MSIYRNSLIIRNFLTLWVCVLSTILCLPSIALAASNSVFIQELTWQEVKERVQGGAVIAIVPTGSTEQGGPHMVTGRHNSIVRYTAGEIASRLGNALVAPTIPYAPSGRISPAEGNMQFPGTLSITPRAYSLVISDVARSLKQHGFRMICFVGNSRASQELQKQVAQALTDEWVADSVQVISVSDYYANNGQDDWNDANGVTAVNPFGVGGHVETSELMMVDAGGVRDSMRASRTERDYAATGATGDSTVATANHGRRYLGLKIEAAVKQIQHASSRAK